VGREKSVRSVEDAVNATDSCSWPPEGPAIENPSQDDIYRTGTVGRVLRMLKLPDGRVKVLVQA